jgi:hypothetical protein
MKFVVVLREITKIPLIHEKAFRQNILGLDVILPFFLNCKKNFQKKFYFITIGNFTTYYHLFT